jgi:3-dehydroquinate synthetase
MIMSHKKNAVEDHNIRTAHKSSGYVQSSNTLEQLLANQNSTQEEIRSSLNVGHTATFQFTIFCLPFYCLKP